VREVEKFKRELPEMAKQLKEALGRAWVEGIQTISTREDEIEFTVAKENLREARSAIQEAMLRVGHAANRALTEGDLFPRERRVCELLYEIFVPERGSSS